MSDKGSILFVDDEPSVLDAIRRKLRSSPLRVVTACSGQEGLERLREEKIDIVVSDLNMPGMNGTDFLRTVKNRWPATIRVMLTGHIEEEAVKTAIRSCDIFRCIAKPWRPDELETVIADAVQEYNISRGVLEGESRRRPLFTLRVISEIKERLLEEEAVSDEQLRFATDLARATGESLGGILVRLNYIDEEKLLDFVSRHLRLPRVRLDEQETDPAVLALIPAQLARRYRMIPIRKDEGGSTLIVAMADAADLMIADEIHAFYHLRIEPVLCSEADIHRALERHYSPMDAIMESLNPEPDPGPRPAPDSSADADAAAPESASDRGRSAPHRGQSAPDETPATGEDAAVRAEALDVLRRAVVIGASDIHINPEPDRTRVRFRIDGVLHEQDPLQRARFSALISCLKIMASLDIAQRWIPQDGRIRLEMEGRDIELRVSTYPTIDGESVVMRILDRNNNLPGIDELGLSERDEREFRRAINRNGGILLVTGPTGSGKTTTLYSAINSLDAHHKHIVTIEEPVELELRNINQGEIREKRGFGFAQALRALMRHDPDVILVGEIRDQETAETAFRAANTGHLVMSTLHTNSAVSAVSRLKDLGVEPFLIGTSLLASLSQRLVRKICPACKREIDPGERRIELAGHASIRSTDVFYAGAGCEQCNGTGYKGRTGIYELFVLDEELRDMLQRHPSEAELLGYAQNAGMTTILEDGLMKARLGVTTLSEVARVL